jgi:hypothetical protein
VAPPFAGLDWYHDGRSVAALGIGASVPSLLDLTPNGRNVSEASGASQPVVIAGGGVYFGGAARLSTPTNAPLLGPGPWSMAVILAADTSALSRTVMSVSNTGVTQGAAFGVGNSKWQFIDEGVGTFQSVANFTAATKTLLVFERDGGGVDAVDAANFNVYVDGTLAVTASRVYFNTLLSRIWYGQRGNGTSIWKGTIYCAMGLSRLFTAPERAALLAHKSLFV